MTADAVTVAWVAPEAPDVERSRALDSWARAHGVRLVRPADARPPPLAVDERVADDVERALDRGRDAIAARDGEAVDRALGAAESLLRAHPELAQAAWQMAEVERTRSARLRRVPPVDPEAADRAWTRAEALDGPRAAGIGEQPAAGRPAAAAFTLAGLPRGAAAVLDGRPVTGAVIAAPAGAHALVVVWNGAPVWAAWIDVPPGTSAVRIDPPAAPPCAVDDMAQAALVADAIDAADVRCTSWIAAAPGATPLSVRVATCAEGRCGPLLAWHVPSITWTPPPERPRSRWPAWATWGLVGAGAAVATGIAVGAAEALERPAPQTRFVSGGIR